MGEEFPEACEESAEWIFRRNWGIQDSDRCLSRWRAAESAGRLWLWFVIVL